jgi:hypothetical protein
MKKTKAAVMAVLLFFAAGAVFAQNDNWAQYIADNFGLSGVTAPQDTEPGVQIDGKCRVWFHSDDGKITEAVFTAFAQQIWNISARVSTDGNHLYAGEKGKPQVSEARTLDSEYEWVYTYQGKMINVIIQRGSIRELRLNLETL